MVAPEWNGGVIERGTVAKSGNEGDSPEIRPVIGSFAFTLHPTYYRTGFFNVGVADQHHIGPDGETIDIYLGNGEEPIRGTINRRGNLNGTPRIMGAAALRDWFQSAADPMESIRVEVLSPNEIRLSSGPF